MFESPQLAELHAKELHKVRLQEAQAHRLVKEAQAGKPSLLQRALQLLQRKPKARAQHAAPQREREVSLQK